MLKVEQEIELGAVATRIPTPVARLRRIRPLAVFGLDIVLIYVALVAAYWFRYDLHIGPPVDSTVGFGAYQELGLLLIAIMVPALSLKGAYRVRLRTEIVHEVMAVISAATIAVASMVVITYMLHQFAYSRGVIVYLWLFLIAFVGSGRILARLVQSMCHRKGLRVRRVLVVGASDEGKMIMQNVQSRPDLGYEIVGFVDRRGPGRSPHFGRFHRLGTMDDLPELLQEHRVDEVIVALPGSAHKELRPVVRLCDLSGVGLKLVPDLFELNLSRVQIDDIAGIPLLDVHETPVRRIERVAKRTVDLLVGSIVFLLTLPLVGMLAIAIRLDSEGAAFIRQERLGKNGRPFTCFKLRSMRVDAEQLRPLLMARNEATGPMFKIRNDPRCTRVGRWLRRLSLDELPQIWNVVRGQMSLVGPRPPFASEVEKYEPWQLRRLEVKPGLTGIWQVSGRSDITFDEMVMMDIMYVDNWSPALDIKILMRTAVAVVAGRGAY